MATGTINSTDKYFPTYTNYIDLSSKSQGSTFTVSRTGFYSVYFTANDANLADLGIRCGGNDVFRQRFSGGGGWAGLLFLNANQTYTVLAKTNVNYFYLYY